MLIYVTPRNYFIEAPFVGRPVGMFGNTLNATELFYIFIYMYPAKGKWLGYRWHR